MKNNKERTIQKKEIMLKMIKLFLLPSFKSIKLNMYYFTEKI